jgi:hypothetical protein
VTIPQLSAGSITGRDTLHIASADTDRQLKQLQAPTEGEIEAAFDSFMQRTS